MGREGRDYWVEQLAEYWESGLTIQEYSELKELPYESVRRWIRVLQKARQADAGESESLELVEVAPLIAGSGNTSGIRASSSEMGGGGSYIDPTTDKEQPSIHFRHNDQANIGFFDGHSEGMSAGESRQTSNGVKKYFTSSGQKIILNSLY